MKNSEKLNSIESVNSVDLLSLFDIKEIDIENDEKEYALFAVKKDDKYVFEIVGYITRCNNSFIMEFLGQNDCVFVGFVGYDYLPSRYLSDLVYDRISDLESDEFHEEFEEKEKDYINDMCKIQDAYERECWEQELEHRRMLALKQEKDERKKRFL